MLPHPISLYGRQCESFRFIALALSLYPYFTPLYGSQLTMHRAASCSTPIIFPAASLLAKDPKTGKEVPWNPVPNGGWIDGSVDSDLPMARLAEMFNVNHFIVSQVNPHVVPFLVKDEEAIAKDAQSDS